MAQFILGVTDSKVIAQNTDFDSWLSKNDDLTTTVDFLLPRYWNDEIGLQTDRIDLNMLDIYVNCQTSAKTSPAQDCTKRISETDSEMMIISWPVRNTLTNYAGKFTFRLCAKKPGTQYSECSWHTHTYTTARVEDGPEPDGVEDLPESEIEKVRKQFDALKEDFANHEARIQVLEAGSGAGGGAGSGVTSEMVNSLWAIIQKGAFAEVLSEAEKEAFKSAWGIKASDEPVNPPVDPTPEEPDEPTTPTLTGIEVTWSAESADVGTDPSTLISSVKANYSDGTSQAVTGYTVTPSALAEGDNTVTVAYQGKTATKSIAGNGTEPEEGVSNESTWTDGVPYTYEPIIGMYLENGVETAYNNAWSATPFLYCHGANEILATVLYKSAANSSNGNYCAWYDNDKKYISKFSVDNYDKEVGYATHLQVPDGASYVRISGKTQMIAGSVNINNNNPYTSFIPKS